MDLKKTFPINENEITPKGGTGVKGMMANEIEGGKRNVEKLSRHENPLKEE